MSTELFKGKKLLILGATAQTVPFVKKAKEKGIITYVADHLTNSVAKRYADFPVLCNCFDIDSLEKTVNENGIDGIILGCADILLPCYVELCKRTNKYCYATEEQLAVFGNKKGLKSYLKKFDLPFIPEYSVDQVLEKRLPKDAFPIFVKPVDNCSSKGMSVCNSYGEFEICYNKALDASRSKTVLIEKKMMCDDISITYTFVNGKIFVTSISDRYVNREQEGLGTITTALIYPSLYTDTYFNTIHGKVCEMLKDLKIKNGVLTVQAFAENGDIMFYDPAFRTTGGQGYIIYDYFHSVDQIGMLVDFAITGEMTNDVNSISEQCNFGQTFAANLVLLIKTGKIGRILGVEEIKKIPGVINFTQCHFENDEVKNKGTLDQTFARLHIVAENKEALKNVILSVYQNIAVEDVNGDNMLMKQFDVSELSRY